jgi:putative ABC transport system substrate-binding protein
MRRRDFLVVAVLAPVVHPALAQQPSRMKRVAMLHPAIKPDDLRIGADPIYTITLEEMRGRGYVEGVNLIVDRYSAEGRPERFSEISQQAIATKPDVIYAVGNPLVLALHAETKTVPIVAWTGDPVAIGIVKSLAHPGGNVTGLSSDAGSELYGKEVELLVQAVGKLSNARALVSAANPKSPAMRAIQDVCERLKVHCQLERLESPVNEAEYRRAFAAMRRDDVDGLIVSPDIENYANRFLLGRLAREYRLPAIGIYSEMAEAGALMSYANDLKAGARRAAAQIVEILNGGNPAEMPFFLESHFELLINLKTAKELGLDVPSGLIARSDRVIE